MAQQTIVSVGPKQLEGILRLPEDAIGLVIFAHGAGSSHLSPRNNHVAEELGRRGIATLLFDLLSEEEALDRRNVFDIPLLGGRTVEAVDWAVGQPALADLPVALFGSSTGAAAALVAAAQAPDRFACVV
ncbi:MAG: alpha/beta family hydrolase [Thalassovita sp.]|nr:alpha/beta family hydrolase [Thalassovita sp.]